MVYYRRNLLVLSLTSFLAASSLNQVVPFLPLFIKEIGVKNGVAFWSGMTLAVQMIAMIVILPFWGKLSDKYGSKHTILIAGSFSSLTYLGMTYCQCLWQLLLLRFLTGVFVFVPASITMVATNTPKSESNRYVAIFQSTVAFGSIIGPPTGSVLANWMGYRVSMLVSGIIMAIGVLLVFLLVEERKKETIMIPSTSLCQDYRLALQKPILVTALCSDIVYGFLISASQPLLILYIQELAGSRVNLFASPLFSLPGLAIILTNYYWCRLGERYTFQRIVLLGLAGTGFLTILQGLVRNIWWFAVSYFLAGLCAAAVNPNTTGLVVTGVETDFQGRAFALQLSSRCFGSFVVPLLAGYVGGLLPLQWVFVVIGLLGLLAVTGIRLQIRYNMQRKIIYLPVNT